MSRRIRIGTVHLALRVQIALHKTTIGDRQTPVDKFTRYLTGRAHVKQALHANITIDIPAHFDLSRVQIALRTSAFVHDQPIGDKIALQAAFDFHDTAIADFTDDMCVAADQDDAITVIAVTHPGLCRLSI